MHRQLEPIDALGDQVAHRHWIWLHKRLRRLTSCVVFFAGSDGRSGGKMNKAFACVLPAAILLVGCSMSPDLEQRIFGTPPIPIDSPTPGIELDALLEKLAPRRPVITRIVVAGLDTGIQLVDYSTDYAWNDHESRILLFSEGKHLGELKATPAEAERTVVYSFLERKRKNREMTFGQAERAWLDYYKPATPTMYDRELRAFHDLQLERVERGQVSEVEYRFLVAQKYRELSESSQAVVLQRLAVEDAQRQTRIMAVQAIGQAIDRAFAQPRQGLSCQTRTVAGTTYTDCR